MVNASLNISSTHCDPPTVYSPHNNSHPGVSTLQSCHSKSCLLLRHLTIEQEEIHLFQWGFLIFLLSKECFYFLWSDFQKCLFDMSYSINKNSQLWCPYWLCKHTAIMWKTYNQLKLNKITTKGIFLCTISLHANGQHMLVLKTISLLKWKDDRLPFKIFHLYDTHNYASGLNSHQFCHTLHRELDKKLISCLWV